MGDNKHWSGDNEHKRQINLVEPVVGGETFSTLRETSVYRIYLTLLPN